MTQEHHVPIPNAARLLTTEINRPLGELDAVIAERDVISIVPPTFYDGGSSVTINDIPDSHEYLELNISATGTTTIEPVRNLVSGYQYYIVQRSSTGPTTALLWQTAAANVPVPSGGQGTEPADQDLALARIVFTREGMFSIDGTMMLSTTTLQVWQGSGAMSAGSFFARGLPTSLVINNSGEMIYSLLGYARSRLINTGIATGTPGGGDSEFVPRF